MHTSCGLCTATDLSIGFMRQLARRHVIDAHWCICLSSCQRNTGTKLRPARHDDVDDHARTCRTHTLMLSVQLHNLQ